MTTANKKLVLSNIYFGLAFLSLAFLWCYAPTIRGLISVWLQDGDYSYALSIPLITAFIIWKKRHLIASTPVSTFWLGGVFFFIFLHSNFLDANLDEKSNATKDNFKIFWKILYIPIFIYV